MALVNIKALRFYANKILPTVYDDSLSYYEVLTKVVEKLNELIENDNAQNEVINNLPTDVSSFAEELQQFKDDVNAEITRFEGETNTAIGEIRTETSTEINAAKSEIQGEFNEFSTALDNEFDEYKGEVNTRLATFQSTMNTNFDNFIAEVNAKIATDASPTAGSNKLVTSGGIYASLQDIMNAIIQDNVPTQGSTRYVSSGGVWEALNNAVTALNTTIANKQNQLTFDTAPTANSLNPVYSGGVLTAINNAVQALTELLNTYKGVTDPKITALENATSQLANTKQNVLTFDTQPVENSANPVTSGGVWDAINGVTPTITVDPAPIEGGTNPVSSGGVFEALANLAESVDNELSGKQNTLTFDITPTQNSGNPVTSGGVWQAIRNAAPTIDVDGTPTEGSGNPVSSGGVYTALQQKANVFQTDTYPAQGSMNPVSSGGVYAELVNKQNALTFDTQPTAGSNNPVTSGGVWSAIQNSGGGGGTGTIDPVPTEGSTNAVSSGGTWSALQGKQNTLTFDTTPTPDSNNIITSGNLYTFLLTNPGFVVNTRVTNDGMPYSGDTRVPTNNVVYNSIRDYALSANTPLDSAAGNYNNLTNGLPAFGEWSKRQAKQTNRIYEGTDLSTTMASEISSFSGIGSFVKALLSDTYWNDYSSRISIGDYFRVEIDGNEYQMQIAGINTYTNYGDTAIKRHIDFISKELFVTGHSINPVNYNNGVANNEYPWLCSDLYFWLNSLQGEVPNEPTVNPATTTVDYTNAGVFNLLPQNLRDNISEKRLLLPKRYSASQLLSDDSGWGWTNIGKLWLPNECEVCGVPIWGGTNGYSVGGSGLQYPLFAGNMNRVKFRNNSRGYWWLLSPSSGNSMYWCAINNSGQCYYHNASNSTIATPICFRIEQN